MLDLQFFEQIAAAFDFGTKFALTAREDYSAANRSSTHFFELSVKLKLRDLRTREIYDNAILITRQSSDVKRQFGASRSGEGNEVIRNENQFVEQNLRLRTRRFEPPVFARQHRLSKLPEMRRGQTI